ncbi:MAG: 2-oxoglutarate dehydrogenase complex E2 component [Gomphillus americanus]|uniref:dihydrolipoyllysine-residue succinyltransferase n=1 Tax=Gomphillus americanus TaxID=1940652 RepID=A0A8H3F4K4_9LECA|nr:MAG: 2-oxoglutarate dehydrogenase complex E2 component [Gomphillus americanus]
MLTSRCLRHTQVRAIPAKLRATSSLVYATRSLARGYGNRNLSSTRVGSRSNVGLHESLKLPKGTYQAGNAIFLQNRFYATVKVPQMAESISEEVGDYVEQDEEIATIETDKIDVAVNAPTAGTIKELLVEEEATVSVGQDIAQIEEGGEPSGESSSSKSDEANDESAAKSKEDAPKEESPAEKEPEKESSSKDVQDPEPTPTASPPKQESQPHTASVSKPTPKPEQPKQQPSKSASPPQSKPSQPESQGSKASAGPVLGSREERRVKMNRMRLRIAERLKQSQNTAASLTTFNEVDMSNIMEFRKLYKDEVLKKTGIKLGFMSAFSKACIHAMKDVPAVNASIEGPGGGDTIVYRDYVDISVAVATEKGLVTPVVRNAEALDMVGIEKAIGELGKKARDNKLTLEDMAGGTFTISNGGVFGSLMGTPIINLPQTAVLGLHAIKEKPVAINGKVEIRPMMYLALTYDHRLLDGREAVTFLVKVKEYIEDPRRMLL